MENVTPAHPYPSPSFLHTIQLSPKDSRSSYGHHVKALNLLEEAEERVYEVEVAKDFSNELKIRVVH